MTVGVKYRTDRRDPEPVNDKENEKAECQATLLATDAGLPTRETFQTPESRNQRVYPRYMKIGPPIYGDWTPGIQGLDPQCTETGPPRDKTTRPGIPQTRTNDFVGSKTSRDAGLHEIRDFVGFKTSRDLVLHGIQDFVGLGTSWDLGLRKKKKLYTPRTRNLFCGVL